MADYPYAFITNGGCPLCEALEGYYEHEPARPHPYCECDITYTNAPSGYWDKHNGGCPHGEAYIEMEEIPPTNTRVYRLKLDKHTATMFLTFEVECCDGTVIKEEKEFVFDIMAVTDTAAAREAWQELDRAVAQYMDELMDRCPKEEPRSEEGPGLDVS